MPAATALAFLGMTNDAKAQTPSSDIHLDNLTINENMPVGTAVGFLTAIDADIENHSFLLVSGAGDEDNASFTILANKLQSSEVFNFEVKSTYSVRIVAIGDDGLSYEKPFVVTIGDVNDKPTIAKVTKDVLQNNTLNLSLADFERTFADEDGDALERIEIISLPSDGVLRLDANPVNVGDIISAADCDLLRYDAPSNIYGLVSFDWRAEDGQDYSDMDGSIRIKIKGDRPAGNPSGDLVANAAPTGTMVGHSGVRPGLTGIDLASISGATVVPGTRPGGTVIGDLVGAKVGEETGNNMAPSFDLNINAYPNPFAGAAEIRYTLPESAQVEINVYNYMGALVEQIINEVQPAGVNSVQFGNGLTNGSYIYAVKVTGENGQTTLYRTGSMVKVK